MDWVAIISALLATLLGSGVPAIFLISEIKKSKRLDNKKKENEIEDSTKDEIIKDWKELANQRLSDLEDSRKMLIEKDEVIKSREDTIEEKNKTISEQFETINKLKTDNIKLKLTQCTKWNCPSRIPPIGYKEIESIQSEEE